MYWCVEPPLPVEYPAASRYNVRRGHQALAVDAIARRAPLRRSSASSTPEAPRIAIVLSVSSGCGDVLRIRPGLCPAANVQRVRPVAGSKPSSVAVASADAWGIEKARPLI